MNEQTVVLNVVLTDREDGGLRVHSDDFPGLILSGADRKIVCDSIAPAIKALFEQKGLNVISVKAARPLHELLNHSSPRSVNLHVQHEQFVIEVAQAA